MNIKNITINTKPPTGLIPRMEYTKKHKEFITSHLSLPYIMLNLDIVKGLVRRGLTANDVLPKGQVITTSTIHDSKLCYYTIEEEIDTIRRFSPAWHIPCDYPVYFEDSVEGRQWFIEALVDDTITFLEEMEDTSVGVIPLIKGITEREWQLSTSRLQKKGVSNFAFYVKQYFGGTSGRNDNMMVEHVRRIVASTRIKYLMLVGYQSDNRIHRIPPEVQAFSGERWIKGSGLNILPMEQVTQKYIDWERKFLRQGKKRQKVLDYQEDRLILEAF